MTAFDQALAQQAAHPSDRWQDDFAAGWRAGLRAAQTRILNDATEWADCAEHVQELIDQADKREGG